MKDFLVIGGLIGMMACTNRVTSRQAEFDRNMFCSSEEAKQAICEMKQYCKAVVGAHRVRNVDSSDCRNPDRTILEVSEEGLSLLPYCYFDIDEFYAHPSP